ncbi:MAG: hypothetical protein GKR88_19770 [Flavobacteriaceae bacterium]|nr:MAG: hypothetical protein GKR88_19770 [Flavobacteriaceae bacterium]
MILIYSHKITPRLRYICKHIFTRILSAEVDFTVKIEEFVAFNGPKLSYTKLPLGKEFFIRSHDLLFEQGVNDLEIHVQKWDDIPCFFNAGMKSGVSFDIFAASFYLISRYEEYLPHVKDVHERFTAVRSLAFTYGFLEKPVIDIWAFKLRTKLKAKFPDYVFSERKYEYTSTVDVDNAFAYKYKNFIRTFGGFVKNVLRLQLRSCWDRFAVLTTIKKDPNDTFTTILSLSERYKIPTVFFFLVGDYTTFDTNVSTSKNKFKLLIKHIVDYAKVGLHPSYFTMKDSKMLKKEKERLEGITNIPVTKSRQHFLRLSLPETYRNLLDLEVFEDYSMGYADHIGFRAGTCTPFYFYDLDFEIQTPLKIHPFALMDTTLNDYLRLTPKQSLGKIRTINHEVRAVNGSFVSLFHNESLSNYKRWKGWQRVYEAMLKMVIS